MKQKYSQDYKTTKTLKLYLDPYQSGDEAVQKGVLEGMSPDVLPQDTQNPHQSNLILRLGCLHYIVLYYCIVLVQVLYLECVLHGEGGSDGAGANQHGVHVRGRAGVVDDDSRGIALFGRELGV